MPSVLIITNVSPGPIYTTLYDQSLSVTCGRSVVISGYSCILHQKNTDYHDITEILLKVAFNTITLLFYFPFKEDKCTRRNNCFKKQRPTRIDRSASDVFQLFKYMQDKLISSLGGNPRSQMRYKV